ncbi:MAG: hypothetical protein KKH29_03965 [Candidatus Omnitrophica bacterium]|nr:hypothetical protein [Candidatus Omnitrophota bacterium]MBU4472645.1 hypothetical protein [Candidatus Omnitrophota bacterium]MCG2706732.1 hypothetical protein [Candidatus Omnitrophota bacterium]
MNSLLNKSVTLLELLIAITLIGLVALGFSSIDLFSRHHVLTADRRAQIQNDVSYVLDHMAKEINKAIGNRVITGEDPIDLDNIAGDIAIRIYVDLAADGQSPGDGQIGTQGDRWRAYRFNGVANQIWYYSDYPGSYEVISRKILDFAPSSIVSDNFVEITVTARCDPTDTTSSIIDNPSITMSTRIKMPSVSTN